ncbi:MAG TPA: hypothetical protein VF771_05685 [Longimicrobiaceae bacterium]
MSPMPARGIRRIVSSIACAALVVSACSDSVTFDKAAAGSYKLTSINSQPLPFTLPGTPAGTTAVITSGSLILLENGRFDEVIKGSLTTPDTATTTNAHTVGDVSASAGSITFKPHFENSYSGTYTATTVTYSKQPISSVTLVYVFTRTN